jgi:hypothetical protein
MRLPDLRAALVGRRTSLIKKIDPKTGKVVAVIDPKTGLPIRPGH